MKEMIELFLEKNPGDLAEIERAINKRDFDTVNASAHRMKTSVGFMGLKHLLGPLEEISQLAEKKNSGSELTTRFDFLRSECLSARAEFETFLRTI
jgi:HPt (histidine-containing phosphotransfer) domain-containing protein